MCTLSETELEYMDFTRLEHHKKIVVSGSLIEVRSYYLRKGARLVRVVPRILDESSGDAVQNERNLSSVSRSRCSLRRILFGNVGFYPNSRSIFLTLTFAENLTDLTVANREFGKFVQRLNYHFFPEKQNYFRYVAVPQFQERGAVHYHVVIFNFPDFVQDSYTVLRDIWGLGSFVNVRFVDDVRKTYSYLVRYMQKNFDDGRLFGRKKYFSSKGLHRTLVISDPFAVEIIERRLGAMDVQKTSFQVFIPSLPLPVDISRYVLSPGCGIFEIIQDEVVLNTLFDFENRLDEMDEDLEVVDLWDSL